MWKYYNSTAINVTGDYLSIPNNFNNYYPDIEEDGKSTISFFNFLPNINKNKKLAFTNDMMILIHQGTKKIVCKS